MSEQTTTKKEGTMTRRAALQTVAVLAMAGHTEGQKSKVSGTGSPLAFISATEPLTLYIALDFKAIVITRAGKTVTINQDELFAALQPPKE